jgi:hypothetical protein
MSATNGTNEDDTPTVNLVVLRGVASAPPEVRTLKSGRRIATLSVRVHSVDPGSTSVPVAVREPPAWVEDLDEGAPIVVVGAVRRRFFKTTTGGTGAPKTSSTDWSETQLTRRPRRSEKPALRPYTDQSGGARADLRLARRTTESRP